jgi:hypothetical protein
MFRAEKNSDVAMIFLFYHGQHNLLDRMQDMKTGSP